MNVPHVPRYFITGTDTDVGKTRVTAGLAHALVASRAHATPQGRVTIVKPVQTGLPEGEPGDAALAAALAGCGYEEFVRFRKPADPWNAAFAEGREPPTVTELATRIDALDGALVVEGAGGIAVPLNAHETFLDLARACALPTLVVVALRLGCINHARLTLDALVAAGVPLAGIVLNDRFGTSDDDYVADVERALGDHATILGILAFDDDDARGMHAAAARFAPQ